MFSIIMPTYNCASVVSKAIRSVLEQSHADFELIIVDDGSSDNTVEVAGLAICGDEKARIIEAPHKGVSAARNLGISEARGDKVLFIDSDDKWEPHLLETCFQKKHENFVVFGFCVDYYTPSGEHIESDYTDKSEQCLEYSVNNKDIFVEQNMAAPWNKVYELDIIKKNDIKFSESCVYLEDLKFNLDYLKFVDKISVIQQDLYRYRIVRGVKQILKRNFKEAFLNAIELCISAKQYLLAIKSSFSENQVLASVCRDAFYMEYVCISRDKDKEEQKRLLSEMNSIFQYNELLSASRGKFFFVFRLLKHFGLKGAQMRLIKRRYI